MVDRTTIETFVNDGEAALPCCFVPKNLKTGLELYVKGGKAIRKKFLNINIQMKEFFIKMEEDVEFKEFERWLLKSWN